MLSAVWPSTVAMILSAYTLPRFARVCVAGVAGGGVILLFLFVYLLSTCCGAECSWHPLNMALQSQARLFASCLVALDLLHADVPYSNMAQQMPSLFTAPDLAFVHRYTCSAAYCLAKPAAPDWGSPSLSLEKSSAPPAPSLSGAPNVHRYICLKAYLPWSLIHVDVHLLRSVLLSPAGSSWLRLPQPQGSPQLSR